MNTWKKSREKEWFIRLLTEGDALLDEETLQRFAEDLGICFSGEYFCIVLRFASDMTKSPFLVSNLCQAC